MKIEAGRRTTFRRPRYALLVATFLLVASAVAVPLYRVDSSSRSDVVRLKSSEGTIKSNAYYSPWASSLNLPAVNGETIAIYAADCSTPKTAFNLGEVICAKTDGVDLITTPGNYYVNWHSPSNGITDGPTITQNPQYFLFALPTTPTGNVGTWKANIGRVSPAESSIIGLPPLFTVSADQPGIGIFAGDGSGGCTNTPKSVFNLQDANKDVCAKVTGGDPSHDIVWNNSRFEEVQRAPLGMSGESTFILNANSSLGDWRVILVEPFGGSVYGVSSFTVIDAANPNADVMVSKGTTLSSVAAGSQVVYTVTVTNLGPDHAAGVEITDSIPANTTFSSFAPTSAPIDTNCIVPAEGASTGDTICTIPVLARGETASFVAAFDVLSGVPSGTVISNTVTITGSTTPDPRTANNSATATVPVEGAGAETCTLTCPANVVVTADTVEGGQPGAFVDYGAAAGDGNCGAVTNNPASGSFFEVGTHSILSSSEFGGGSCSFTVTVLDSNPPTISCPANITEQLQSGETEATFTAEEIGTPIINASGGGTVTFARSDNQNATYDENGNVITPAVVHALTDPFQIGSTGILWTVTDAGGRTASCTQIITVVAAGNRPPVTISCPADVTAAAPEGTCEATISASTIGTPTTNPSDNDVVVVSQRSDGRPLSDAFPGGTTQITWTATDNQNGSVASCTQKVTVTVSGDTTPPTLNVPPNVSTTTSSCTATLDDELGTATAEDSGACGDSVTITRTGVPPNFVFPTGTTTITYTATDSAGNSTTGTQTVTVNEDPNITPTIDAPQNLTVYTGPNATTCDTFVGDATLGTATASDNCPGVVVTRTGVPAGNVFPVGTTTITYKATDRVGNFAEDTQTVTVIDNTPPVVTPPGPVTLHTGPGATSCSVTVSDLDGTFGTGSATDNCPGVGAVSRSGVPSGNVFPVGETILTYSATDAHGNTGTATQVVTVIDNTVPVISCPADIVLEPTCPSGAIATYATPTATDNCAVQSVVRTAGGASGSVFPIGTTTVTHVATDIYGNTASCSFTVTVKTALQTLDDLKASVAGNQQLTGPQRNGLLSKLDAAKQHIENGNQNGACSKLADFVNSVENFINHGDVSAATGNAWISTANNIRNTIGCTGNPCT